MNTEMREFTSVTGTTAKWKRQAAELFIQYDLNTLEPTLAEVSEDIRYISGYRPNDRINIWPVSASASGVYTASVRVPQWELELFNPLKQGGFSSGSTTLSADLIQQMLDSQPLAFKAPDGNYVVSVSFNGKTESLNVKESELSKVRISLVPKIVIGE